MKLIRIRFHKIRFPIPGPADQEFFLIDNFESGLSILENFGFLNWFKFISGPTTASEGSTAGISVQNTFHESEYKFDLHF